MSLVGFIGLGNMGAHMARHLMRNGHKLIVYDVNKKVLEQFKTEGCEAAEHPAEIASASKSILTMLPNSSHIKDVFTADNGLLKNMQPGTLCMDSSTIDHVVSVEIAALCYAKQSVYVDAPVSGGVKGAQDATLTFMVGSGECEKTFTCAKEYLKCMGKNIVDCGKVGNGQTAKICNNMLAGISMIAVAETINLGIRMGLSGKQLTDIINTSSGRCWSSDTYNPVPGVIEGIPPSSNYNGGFACSLMAKDLSLAQNAATNMQTSIPMGSLAHQIYRLMAQHPDFSNKDFGAIYRFLSEP